MARKKRRTRGHIIADLSENLFERKALLVGFSVERIAHDYGYDLILYTYTSKGEIENGYVSVQLKASDSLTTLQNNTHISFTLKKKDLLLWLKEFNPVILVVYNAKTDIGYWLYLQSYFESLEEFDLKKVTKNFNVHIPIANLVSEESMQQFALKKQNLYKQLKNITHQNL